MKIESTTKPEEELSLLREKINNIVIFVTQSLPQSLILPKDSEIIVLCVEDKLNDLKELIRHICRDIEHEYPSIQVYVGIGEQFNDVLKARESFQQAKKVIDVLGFFHFDERIATYDELGLYSLFFPIDNKEVLESFVKQRLGPLLEYDKKRKGSLLLTLDMFLQKQCSLKSASEELFIHIKTMTYRIRRIEEILNVRLSDAEVCFNLRLALKLHFLLLFYPK